MSFAIPPVINAAPSLRASRISKSYASGQIRVRILNELNLTIYTGELSLITGPSGCGKSTLLSLMSGLQMPDTGIVTALGEEVGSMSRGQLERFRLQHTGFIFQGFNLFAALTAREQVLLPLSYLGLSRKDALQRADAALAEVDMASHANDRPAALSGGERQRVAIARALAKQPRLLFADEPTSALDAGNGQNIVSILRDIAHSHGTTVLCVSHDPRLVQRANRVLDMEDGCIHNDWRPAAQPHRNEHVFP